MSNRSGLRWNSVSVSAGRWWSAITGVKSPAVSWSPMISSWPLPKSVNSTVS